MHHSDSAHRRSPQAVSHLILDVAGAQHRLLLRFPSPIPKPIIDPTLAPPHHVSRILLHPKCLLLFLRTNVSSTLVSQHSGAFRVLFLLMNLRNHAWLRPSVAVSATDVRRFVIADAVYRCDCVGSGG